MLNELTDSDLQTLQGRFVDQSGNYPKDALHTFAENSFVDNHNENIINQITEEKINISCHDTVVSENIPQSQRMEFICSLPSNFSKTGGLQKK